MPSLAKVQATKHWWVADHVVDRFIERVGRFGRSRQEIAEWLRANAHLSVPVDGEKLRDGKRCYRLEHPWGKPDAVLVVGIDPDGTRAVVTCGWWEELDSCANDPETDIMSCPPKETEKPAVEPQKVKKDRKFLPLSFLPRPPGPVLLDFIEPGLSLDPSRLMTWELLMWKKLVISIKCFNAQGVKGGDKITKEAKKAERALAREVDSRRGDQTMDSCDMMLYFERMQAKDDEIASLKAALTEGAK